MQYLDFYISLTTLTFLINSLIEYKAYLSAKKRAFKFKRFNDYFITGKNNIKSLKKIYLYELPSILIDSIIPINNLIVMYYEIEDYEYTEDSYYGLIRDKIIEIEKIELEDREEIKRIIDKVFPNNNIKRMNNLELQKILKEKKALMMEDYTEDSVIRTIEHNNKRYIYEYKYKE